tara:strand:+ start:873 stop:1241 length:369 start_codon:yes stop_codon:yes gene_type:complete
MDIERIKENINDEDFIIRIRPFADDDGKWTGEVDISVMAFPDNPVDDDDYEQLMHFCKMMCASVPIMQESKELRDLTHEYVINFVDTEMEIDVELEEEVGVERTYDGNIIHLNFNSKTGGSA